MIKSLTKQNLNTIQSNTIVYMYPKQQGMPYGCNTNAVYIHNIHFSSNLVEVSEVTNSLSIRHYVSLHDYNFFLEVQYWQIVYYVL